MTDQTDVRLVCPRCGDGDQLYTIETMPVEYPATFTHGADGIAQEYTGGPPIRYDDAANWEDGWVRCRSSKCLDAAVLDFPADQLITAASFQLGQARSRRAKS